MYRALSGKNGEGWALSYSCRRTFAVWRWLPELNWGLVLRQDRDEILEPIHKLQSELLLFTPLAILFLYWMVYRIAYKVTEPMTRLTRETEQGDIRQFEPGTVSEVNKLAAALQKYEQQLMEEKQNAVDANRTKDDFLATMSHELRTPLAVIIGNCELLKSNADIDQQVLQQLSTMENAAQHQLALVGDILDLKKVESDQLDIDEHPFSVCEMIREIEQMFSTEAESTNLRWSVNCPATSGLIIGDEQRIKRILLNLVDNAFKFTHQGWITLMVELETGVLHFTVTDSGIGMSEDIQGRLFERFKQADSTLSRRFGGVGLGLYISNHLARSMDGSISVSSKEGIGSSFELILPYKVAHQEVPSTEDDSGKEIQTSTLNGSVLVVEDTHTIQQLVKRILEKMGVEVTLAGNGQEAVDLVAARRFDLVLMDLQMPVMDGITASKQIRASGNQVPIVALTANVMQKHRDAFEEADCNGFLEKPINKEALREELERYLHSG